MNFALRAAYASVGTLAEWAASVARADGGKLAASLAGRHGVLDRFARWSMAHRDPARPLVWMHAPSVGEGLQARPVIELLRQRRPDVQVVYTHFSSSAAVFASRVGADYADYLPFDTTHAAHAMLRALRPSAIVFSKVDVWPILVDTARRARIPVALISATLDEASGRRGLFARALLDDAYAALTTLGAIDHDDAKRLVALGADGARIHVTGDTRYDQVWARARAVDLTSALLAPLVGDRPTLVAGSTWPADEAVLEPAWRAVRERVSRARLIIAPHEVTAEHLASIEAMGTRLGISLARLGTPAADTADVVLVDRVGVLGDLYALATAAFVGGGFHAAGLHSVLEPAAYGAPVLHGPQFEKNGRDARRLIDVGGGRAVAEAAAMSGVLVEWLGDPAARDAAGQRARELVERGRGAAEKSFALVNALLPNATS